MEAIATKIAETSKRSPKVQALIQSPKISVIPIPLHATKLKSRGFNQAEVLARHFCAITRLPCYPNLLQRVKDTKAQMQTKSMKEREENLANAFTVASKASSTHNSRSVILFDDIYTTGVTISEAIASLASSNITVRGVIVIARPQFER